MLAAVAKEYAESTHVIQLKNYHRENRICSAFCRQISVIISFNLMLDTVAQAKDEIAKEDVDEESEGDLAEKVFPKVTEEEEDDKSE